ncbi:hypothetical protein TWF481_002745 [Arthrobotrys musiformis]|uniref:Uncharacterized protein n=1 Tax=Arthrobotrys musiformis TaxID=47236 RepID=A0AAV9VU07_9PEZI
MDQDFTPMKQFHEALQVGDLGIIKKISSNEQYARLTVDVKHNDEATGLTSLTAIAAAAPSKYSALAIRKSGADINHSGPEKNRPIHIAARQNNSQAPLDAPPIRCTSRLKLKLEKRPFIFALGWERKSPILHV